LRERVSKQGRTPTDSVATQKKKKKTDKYGNLPEKLRKEKMGLWRKCGVTKNDSKRCSARTANPLFLKEEKRLDKEHSSSES